MSPTQKKNMKKTTTNPSIKQIVYSEFKPHEQALVDVIKNLADAGIITEGDVRFMKASNEISVDGTWICPDDLGDRREDIVNLQIARLMLDVFPRLEVGDTMAGETNYRGMCFFRFHKESKEHATFIFTSKY